MTTKKLRSTAATNFDKMYSKKKKKINTCKSGLSYSNCVISETGQP